MKKILLLIMILAAVVPKTVFAADGGADSACVIEALTGDVVFEKNAYEKKPMASTTKIMTAVVALENSNMNEIVNISENAANQEGSSAYITAGESMYMQDLLYGLMLNSGNDAAVAIAEHIAGSSESFAEMMNKKAREIGAKDTSFENPSGLDSEAHYTTAYDLALITRYAMKNPDFAEIVSTEEILKNPIGSREELWYINHNKLLKTYDGCVGVKTGYTKTAGRCLVSAAERDGAMFIAVTLNDGSDWADHAQMLDEAFAEYGSREIVGKGETVKKLSLSGKSYSFVTADSFTMPFREGKMKKINVTAHMADGLSAPINAGEKVGYMEITYGGEEIGTVDIISEKDIYADDNTADYKFKNSFFNMFIRILKLLSV